MCPTSGSTRAANARQKMLYSIPSIEFELRTSEYRRKKEGRKSVAKLSVKIATVTTVKLPRIDRVIDYTR